MDIRKKVVYILGAGCSKEDKAPLVREFFNVAFNEVLPKIDKPQLKKRFLNIKEFRDLVLPQSNVEELLSYIDMQGIYKIKKQLKSPHFLRKDLIYLIAKTIEVNMGVGSSENYANFKSNYLGSVTPIPTVISFNWDIALDNTLISNSLDFSGESDTGVLLGIDYGTDFRYFTKKDKILKANRNLSYKLLKLHGSLNWLFCKSCSSNNKYFADGDKVMVRVSEGEKIECPECKKNLIPVIIPPTFNKLKDQGIISLIKEVWVEAFNAIEDSECIFIIGYSFPEDDVHFKLFLRSALYANYLKNKKTINIIAVNYKKYIDEKAEFESHYKKIIDIPEAEIRPKFHYLKFGEFADSNIEKFMD